MDLPRALTSSRLKFWTLILNLCAQHLFLVRLKEHSSNGKRGGGGGGGFYLSAHISQSIYPRKINLVLNDGGQKSYLESTLILAILSKKFS